MNDLERRLKDALDADAAKAPLVSAPPGGLRRRVRGRQVARSAVVMLTVSAVALVSFAGLRAIDRGADDGRVAVDDPWAGYEVFDRTATVGNFTITSSSDWYLVNQWPWARTVAAELKEERIAASERCPDEPTPEERRACRQAIPRGLPGDGYVVPMLMLGNTDRGLTTSPCFDPNFTVGPEEAVMTITLDSVYMISNFGAGDRQQWPVAFDSPPADDRASCGAGSYVYFASGNFPYVAHFAFGDEVPDDERQALIDAFEGMHVGDDQAFLMEEPNPDDAAAYVIAGGENAAGPWTLEVSPRGDEDLDFRLIGPDGDGVGLSDVLVPDREAIQQAGGDPTFGVVTEEASAVELRLEEGTPPIPASLVPLPPSMPLPLELFFVPNGSDVQGSAVALGLPPTGPTTAPPAADASLSGDVGGVGWSIAYDFDGGRHCAAVQIDREAGAGAGVAIGGDRVCIEPTVAADGGYLEALTLPGEAGTLIWGFLPSDPIATTTRWIAPGSAGTGSFDVETVGPEGSQADLAAMALPITDGAVTVKTQVGSDTSIGQTLYLSGEFFDDSDGDERRRGGLAGYLTFTQRAVRGDGSCARVFNEAGVIERCADDAVHIETFRFPGQGGQLLAYFAPRGEFIDGLELDTPGGVARSRLCATSVCAIRIPAGSGRAALWTLQRGQRADVAYVIWSPGEVDVSQNPIAGIE